MVINSAFLLQKLKNHWLFVIILIVAAILRFYRLPEMATFDFDQEYASNFASSVIKEFPIQMVGQGLSVQGLFMGPWYFYYLVPFFYFFKLNPIGGFIGSVFLGLFTIWIYYSIIGKVFNRRIGLIAALMRAISFSGIDTDWAMTPAFSSDLMVIVTWYLFYRYWHNDTKYFWPLTALCFGLYSSFHPILFPFYGVFIVLIVIKKRLPKPRELFISVLVFLLPLVPLIAFEYFRKLTEVKKLLSLFTAGQGSTYFIDLSKWVNHIRIIASGFVFVFENPVFAQIISLMITIVIVGLMVYLTVRKLSYFKNKYHLAIVLITTLVFSLYYLFLPVHITEYYFGAPVVLLNIYLAVLLGSLSVSKTGRVCTAIFIILFCFANFRRLYFRWSSTSLMTFYHKDRIVKKILENQPIENPFFVSYIKRLGWNFGFNYLFKYYGRMPFDRPINGSTYTVVIPREMAPDNLNFASGNVGLIIEK